MPIAVARTPGDTTVHARCDRCGSIAQATGLTAGAAIDLLEADGWAVSIRTSAAACPACADAYS